MARDNLSLWALVLLYRAASIGTFVFLTLFDGYEYNLWNWMIALPVNGILGAMWPVYWGILRWVF